MSGAFIRLEVGVLVLGIAMIIVPAMVKLAYLVGVRFQELGYVIGLPPLGIGRVVLGTVAEYERGKLPSKLKKAWKGVGVSAGEYVALRSHLLISR